MTTDKTQSTNQICLIRLSALGDCCHALAVIENIRSSSPTSNITWVIGKTEYQLFKDIQGIDFIVVDKKKLLTSYLKIKKRLKGRYFDVALNMHASMSANLISLAIPAKRKVGYDKSRARDLQNWFCNEYIPSIKNQHVLDGMLEFSKHIHMDSTPTWTPLRLKPEEDFAREQVDSNKITCLISPCSSQRYGDQYNRSWSIDNYAELIRHLLKTENVQVILTGGNSPAEQDYAKKLDALFDTRVLNLISKTSIREMAALIKYSDFIISPDSGPAHIGTLMGKPVIGLYAMSNPKRSGPYNSNKWLINKYDEALRIYMNQSPTEVQFGQKIKHPDAMNLIKPNDVIEQVNNLINKN